MDMQVKSAPAIQPGYPGSRTPVGLQVWDSFTGSDRILDLFDSSILSAAGAVRAKKLSPQEIAASPGSGKAKLPDLTLSEAMLNVVVDKVMKRMSAEIIREVAWEVVPELSEGIIRRTIEEQNKA